MKYILVTGGAGYIGSHIVDLLCDANFDVIVFDNLSNGFKENLNDKAHFCLGDIKKQNDLDLVFQKYEISSIIHMAALKDVGDSMSDPATYTSNNIIGSINLISTAIKYNVTKFILSSTAAVYGTPTFNPIDEGHPLSPINHYGFSKMYIEKYLSWISKIESLKFISLRYFNAAGYTSKEGLIKYKEKSPQNLLPVVMEVANKDRSDFQIYGSDYNTKDGTCIRDYIHVQDLANAHLKSLDFLDNNNSQIFNLSTGIGCSVLDIVNKTEIITGEKIKYSLVQKRPGDPAVLTSSYKKAEQLLDWKPTHSIEDIIASMWKIYKKD